MNQMSTFAGMALDWKSCVHSKRFFEPDMSVMTIYDSLREQRGNSAYAAIVEDGRPIGLVSRAQVGLLLGSKFGHCLFAKKTAREFMSKEFLRIYRGMTAQEVLGEALTRPDPSFYDDVVLVDDAGTYGGLIHVRALVQLQSALLTSLEAKLAQME
jgi:hypothetical protein